MRHVDTERELERIRCIELAAEHSVEEGLRNVSGAWGGQHSIPSLKVAGETRIMNSLSKVLEPEALTKSRRRGPQSDNRDWSFEAAFGVRGCLGDNHPIRSMCLKQ